MAKCEVIFARALSSFDSDTDSDSDPDPVRPCFMGYPQASAMSEAGWISILVDPGGKC